MRKRSMVGGLAALALSLLALSLSSAMAQQAPLTIGGQGQGPTPVESPTPAPSPTPVASPNPVPAEPGGTAGAQPGTYEPNNAVTFREEGEVPYPLDTVTSQRLAVVMEYLRNDGVRDTLGGVTAWQEPDGTHFKIVVTRFTPGYKGFHLLSHGNCDPFARNGRLELGGAAGSLYNPTGATTHKGPFGDGYLGALPKAEANENGWIFMTLVATEVRLEDLRGRALVLREDNDNYQASPPLGGSGGIAACGLVR